MTEEEWLAASDPTPMLEFLIGKVTDRKLRLLGVAVARGSWDRLEDERSRRAVEAAEQFADGLIGISELAALADDAWDVRDEMWDAGPANCDDRLWLAQAAGLTASVFEWNRRFNRPGPFEEYPFSLPSSAHCGMLRDIFGNPFHPAALDPDWLTLDVIALAEGIYEDLAFDRMPILADALQDAGCEKNEILNHCREPGEHVRGCWVIDLLTGRK